MTVARGWRKRWAFAAAGASIALVAAACGGSSGSSSGASSSSSGGSSSGGSSNSPVIFDVYSPFSGANAFIGTTFNLPPVQLAAHLINKAGGIMGHPVKVVTTDSGSDPADAIPALKAMFVKHSSVAALFGISSDVAPATFPVVESHHLVTMSLAGTASLAHTTYKYVYRLAAPDSLAGYGAAAVALHEGYKRAAMVYDSTGTSQSDAQSLEAAYKAQGGKIVLNETLQVDQPSYRTEAAKLAQAKPQVIFTETDPQTAGTFFSNMKQLGALGTPVIGGGEVDSPQYFADVAKAVGGDAAESKFMHVANFAAPQTPGLNYLNQQWKAFAPGKKPLVSASQNIYDSVNIVALAMIAAHSTDPKVFVNDIKKVTNNTSGTMVTNFAQGAKDLKAGKQIYYDGAVGEYVFNQYNWVLQGFDLYKLTASGSLKPTYTISGKAMAKLLK